MLRDIWEEGGGGGGVASVFDFVSPLQALVVRPERLANPTDAHPIGEAARWARRCSELRSKVGPRNKADGCLFCFTALECFAFCRLEVETSRHSMGDRAAGVRILFLDQEKTKRRRRF